MVSKLQSEVFLCVISIKYTVSVHTRIVCSSLYTNALKTVGES